MSLITLDRSGLSPAYAFLDPHGGKADLSRVASRSAMVIGCSDSLGRVFVLHSWAGRVTTPTIMTKMEEAVERFALKTLGVEKDGLAGLWTDALRINANLRQKRFPLLPVSQPKNQEKIYRIRTTLQPLISRGMLFLQEDQIELKNEIVSFPMSVRLDLVDALASLVRHVIPPVRTKAEKTMREDALLKYLRDTGAPPQEIERIARLRHGVGT